MTTGTIQCSECGKEVSRELVQCPHCGAAVGYRFPQEMRGGEATQGEAKFPCRICSKPQTSEMIRSWHEERVHAITPTAPTTTTASASQARQGDRTKQVALAGIAAFLVFIGAFLPWASISVFGAGVSISGVSAGEGILTLLLSLGAGALLAWYAFSEGGEALKLGGAAILGLIISILSGIWIADLQGINPEFGLGVSAGAGLWLTLIGGIVLTLLAGGRALREG